MFCPQCGTQLPDGTTVCTSCNHVLKLIPSAAKTLPATPVNRNTYFLKYAPTDKKIMQIVALALGVLSALMVVLSANKTVNGSIFDLPIMALMGVFEPEEYEEYKELGEAYDEAIEEIEDAADDFGEVNEVIGDMLGVSIDEDVIDEIEDELGMSAKKFFKLFKPLSINSMLKLSEIFEVDDDEDVKIIKLLVTIVNIYAFVMVVLTALGVIFNKTWLMVLTYVLSFLYVLATGGVLLWVFATAAYIATAVLFSKLKFEYKVYLAGYGIN
ncbi:MAG: hypothetical protein IJD70_00520 [Clostridia bacterium]|nr:hypothetical protein [Clostridia bacterium]